MDAREQEGKVNHQFINWANVEKYLRESITEIPNKIMQVEKFTEGYSNLTYLLTIGDWQGVLRRPPFGKIPPKAHDMQREFNVLSKVNPVFPLAPKPYVYGNDPSIMEKHFYVMEMKQGLVIDDKLPEIYGDSNFAGPLISKSMIETLTRLQSINYKEAGLNNLGKPEGYLERQVNGWINRYENSRTDTLSNVAELESWLRINRPLKSDATIVHNDIKLNNLVFDESDTGKIIGILDWEMSTIGDPLTDLGSTIAYWGQQGDPDMGITVVSNQPGFYSRREFIEEYAKTSGRDVSEISYYLAFGFYKLAVILQQIYFRWKSGELNDNRFEFLNEAISNLFEMANLARLNRIL